MPADECDDEGADGNHPAALGAREIEGAAYQGRAEPATLELSRDLGMQERELPRCAPVIDEGGAAVEFELEAVAFRIVANGVCHAVLVAERW